jgi:hypothetical protein
MGDLAVTFLKFVVFPVFIVHPLPLIASKWAPYLTYILLIARGVNKQYALFCKIYYRRDLGRVENVDEISKNG